MAHIGTQSLLIITIELLLYAKQTNCGGGAVETPVNWPARYTKQVTMDMKDFVEDTWGTNGACEGDISHHAIYFLKMSLTTGSTNGPTVRIRHKDAIDTLHSYAEYLEQPDGTKKKNAFYTNYRKREWVFGGYIEINMADSGTHKTYYQHKQCGVGYYSAKPRLNNPTPSVGPTEEPPSSDAPYIFNTITFLDKEGKKTRAGFSPACCPIMGFTYRCCRVGTWNLGHTFYECETKGMCFCGGEDCRHVLSVAHGLPEEIPQSHKNAISEAVANGMRTGSLYTGDAALQWEKGSAKQVSQNLVNGARELDGVLRQKIMCPTQWTASRQPAIVHSLDAGWGPELPGPFYRQFDAGWSKQNQCKSCTRFGAMYYAPHAANSLCVKAGPGRVANMLATVEYTDERSMWRYFRLKKNGDDSAIQGESKLNVCQADRFTIRVEWKTDGDDEADDEKSKIRVTILHGSGPQQHEVPVTEGTTAACRFDSWAPEAFYLKAGEVFLSSKCVIPNNIQVPIYQPDECASVNTNPAFCVHVATVTAVALKRDNYAFLETPSIPTLGEITSFGHNTEAMGDRKVFATVDLGQEDINAAWPPDVPDGKCATDAARRKIYKGATLSGLRAVKDTILEYEIFSGYAKPSALACSGATARGDHTEAQNSFTYYYPFKASYNVDDMTTVPPPFSVSREHTSPRAFVESYKAMHIEQRDGMLRIAATMEDRAIKGTPAFPYRVSTTTRKCLPGRNRECMTTKGTTNIQNYEYEALPSQELYYQKGTPKWNESLYFSDFPNYSLEDVKDGWGGKWNTGSDQEKKHYNRITNAFQDGMRTLSVSAVCRRCTVGHEGNPAHSARFLRAVLGPVGAALEKNSNAALRVTAQEYEKVCRRCGPGMFNGIPGQSCKPCPPGTFSNTVRRSTLPAFYTSPAPRRCWSCLEGHACMSLGDPTQKKYLCPVALYGNMCPCLKGTYADQRGLTKCKLCPPGRMTAQAGSTRKSECLPNVAPSGYRHTGPYMNTSLLIANRLAKFSHSGDDTQLPPEMVAIACDKGTYSDGARLFTPHSVTCTKCGAGSYTDKHATVRCGVCPPGQYIEHTGATACKTCVSDETSETRHNFFVDPSRVNCTQCPDNSYLPAKHFRGCVPCEPCYARSNLLGQAECVRMLMSDHEYITGCSDLMKTAIKTMKCNKQTRSCIPVNTSERRALDIGDFDDYREQVADVANVTSTLMLLCIVLLWLVIALCIPCNVYFTKLDVYGNSYNQI